SLHPGLSQGKGLEEQVLTYLLERFKAWYADDDISAEVFMSVLAKDLDNPLDFHLRIHAVHQFNQLADAANLAAANKRVSNILAKSDAATLPADVDPALFEKAEERALFEALADASTKTTPLLDQRDYTQAM